jgi:ATP-binding cassette subfamily B protein
MADVRGPVFFSGPVPAGGAPVVVPMGPPVRPGTPELAPTKLGPALAAGVDALLAAWRINPVAVLVSIGADTVRVVAHTAKLAAEGQTVAAVVESRSLRTLVRRGSGIGLAAAVGTGSGALTSKWTWRVGRAATQQAEMRVLDALADVELAELESPEFQDRLNAALHAASQQHGMTTAALTLLPAALSLTAGVVLLARRDRVLLVLAAVGIIPQVLILRRLPDGRRFHRPGRELRESGTLRNWLTSPSTHHELILFDAKPLIRARYDEAAAKVAATQDKQMGSHGPRQLLTQLASRAASVPVVARTAVRYLRGEASAAEASTSGLANNGLSSSVHSVYSATRSLRAAAAHVAPYREFVAQAPEAPKGGRPAPAPFSTIVFEHVSFTYRGSTEPVLRDVTLELSRGQSVALVGENGCGKTTLAKLLCGLYRPTTGRILWDGIDVAHLDMRSHRAQISAVFQDFVRYQPFTAAENIAVGCPSLLHDRARIVDAARRAGAHDFISALPSGYDTVLSRAFDGVNPSAGQWQRIALARAFLRDAQLVVLDEPTAALDPRAERELFDTVVELCRSRTALLISHRLSSVRSADTIHVLDGGRIVESGSHDDLIAIGGIYAELFSLQADAYR